MMKMKTITRLLVANLTADETVFVLQLFSKQRLHLESLESLHSFKSNSSRSLVHPRCTMSPARENIKNINFHLMN